MEIIVLQEREIAQLPQQAAWFQRQLFGHKSEKRLPVPDGVQGVLGEGFVTDPLAHVPRSIPRELFVGLPSEPSAVNAPHLMKLATLLENRLGTGRSVFPLTKPHAQAGITLTRVGKTLAIGIAEPVHGSLSNL